MIRRGEALASARRRGDSTAIVLNVAAAFVCAAACAATIVIGLIAMTHE
jgi:hypothetical protein